MFRFQVSIAAIGLMVLSAPAIAQTEISPFSAVTSGILHPFFGIDHILAMVAVGLWAAMLGGRAIAIVPSAFVGTMLVGFILAVAGVPLLFVEPMILASLVVLGLVIAMTVQIDTAYGAALVGLFALFHGYAHATESGASEPLYFGVGLAASTAALHFAGIALGTGITRHPRLRTFMPRLIGAMTALAGVVLAYA